MSVSAGLVCRVGRMDKATQIAVEIRCYMDDAARDKWTWDHVETLIRENLPPILPWTRNRPTKPGWYWAMENPERPAKMIQVDQLGGNGPPAEFRYSLEAVTLMDAEFAGPLQPPA